MTSFRIKQQIVYILKLFIYDLLVGFRMDLTLYANFQAWEGNFSLQIG